MVEPKLEVPAELRDLTEKAIEQTEQAFRMFFDASMREDWFTPPTFSRPCKFNRSS